MDLTRRDFLGAGAVVGGLAACAALPAVAEDDLTFFPGRGRHARLSLQFHEIEAGAEKPFTLLHISDTHLTAAYPHESKWRLERSKVRSRTCGGMQETALRDSIAWAKSHTDYILHTGDLIDFQSEANFDLVKKYYGEGGASMFGCIGNLEFYHGQDPWNSNEADKDVTRKSLAAVHPFDISFQSTIVNGVNFIALDNAYRTVTAEQAARFEAEVKKGLPIILCVHCPVQMRGIARAAQMYWGRDAKRVPDFGKFKESFKDGITRDFVAYLRSQPLLKAILCGHAHFGSADRFSPTAMQYMVAANFLFCGQQLTIL